MTRCNNVKSILRNNKRLLLKKMSFSTKYSDRLDLCTKHQTLPAATLGAKYTTSCINIGYSWILTQGCVLPFCSNLDNTMELQYFWVVWQSLNNVSISIFTLLKPSSFPKDMLQCNAIASRGRLQNCKSFLFDCVVLVNQVLRLKIFYYRKCLRMLITE